MGWEIAKFRLERDLKWPFKIHRWKWTADSMGNSNVQKFFLIVFIANILSIQVIEYILDLNILSTVMACSN